LVKPARTWTYLRRWVLLARYAELSYASIKHYRRELMDDREFQQHLEHNLGHTHSGFSRAAELYVVVRALKPHVTVETGVASGVSSSHILRALAANGAGTLYSIDLPRATGTLLPKGRPPGWLVPDSLRRHWKLSLGASQQLLPDLLASLDRVDLFFHDSDHSYDNMRFELEQALPRLSPGGLLVCDDSTLHGAWDDFCAKHHLHPNRIIHMGVTRKPGHQGMP
jgi:predicted O-methyltransferase YrrM